MYLVIGASGFLGRYIIKNIIENTYENIIATARNIEECENSERVKWIQCDICKDSEFDKLVNDINGYDNIKTIFLAAYHQPDDVAANPGIAWDINVTSLSKCVNKLDFVKKLFYISTDSVYGNSIDNYRFKECDSLNPVNIYGRNKAAAEAITIYSGRNVIRYPFLIAKSLCPNKEHFFDKIIDKLSNGEKVEMFEDSLRSSLDFNSAAKLLIELCEKTEDVPNIINVCGDDDLSKYDVGLMIAEKYGYDKSLVVPISIKSTNSFFKTPRADSTLMDNSLLKSILNLESIKINL